MDTTSLTWQPLTRDDAQAAADLLNAMETVDRIGENYTAQDTLQELVDPYADLERASLAAFDGDVMVGYMKIRYKRFAEDVHRVFLDGGVHPDHRRRGIGTALVEAGVAAAKTLHALHHPALRLAIDVHKAGHIAGLAELLGPQGFAPVRHFQHMEHPLGAALPEAEIPDGLRIEQWSADNDEDFRVTRNEAYADNWIPAPVPADNWKNKIANHTLRPEASFLLRDAADGTAVGMLVANHWEGDAAVTGVRDVHFMNIGTIPAYRNRGVAGALIGHALRAAAEHGFHRASVNADSASPAGPSGIFARAGFTSKRPYVRWALEV
ncbi:MULTISPECIES: GNAT family N-acetyltransferase [unclassified Amycolatopsis]|uniref:GNAT family N-acetyltransferase n=1 Tax=unclassified Amycolatopsis TaxID=2618356 RepID=UPI001C6A6538|nr:GNAT family N-acetyltransferase [Amycolatopsis sp. DSM 110486]QYN18542.1 GNAT family N-acetyltransferase [Amycolatopsis sp. DSM 110486]